MLYLGCYYAVAARRDSTLQNEFFTRIRHTTVMFLKIPSQVVVYGSAFPLTCYLIAHVIDAPIVYELTAQKFDSFHGLFNLTFMEFVTICSVQMRNVWVLAAMAHVIVRISTQHDDWSPLNGVWSVPQFSIVVISSLTILAQFRFISLRYTPITSIERIDVFSRLHPTLNELLNENGGGGKESLGGVFIDIKAACCSALVLFMFAGIVSVVLQCFYLRRRMKLVVGWSHLITPLSAGILWPTSALAVSWNDDLFKFGRLEAILRQHRSVRSLFTTATPSVMPCSFRAHKTSNAMTMITTTLESRPRFVESITYLMNITVLTDPITFLCWRNRVGYYRARKSPHREYLVPILHGEPCIELNWEALSLTRIKSADELAWSEIIQCS
uniref:Uncharacterized protein n=1 Tax=Globisporangium ultimum (strain ATCC 200006 / CBS 805.95 / DAOM BR144) TaxID=431595 RepID=K3WQC7_GLOUD